MKVGAIEKLQHLNAVVTFLFCVLYCLLQHGVGPVILGVFAWACSLPFLYFANLITYRGMSEEDVRNGKKAGILGNWCLIFLFLWVIGGSNMLIFATIIILISLIMVAVYVAKSKKKTS